MKTICLYIWKMHRNPKTGRKNMMWSYAGKWKNDNTHYSGLTAAERKAVFAVIKKVRAKTGAVSYKVTIYSPKRIYTNIRFNCK